MVDLDGLVMLLMTHFIIAVAYVKMFAVNSGVITFNGVAGSDEHAPPLPSALPPPLDVMPQLIIKTLPTSTGNTFKMLSLTFSSTTTPPLTIM
jgi:hypothetical protein